MLRLLLLSTLPVGLDDDASVYPPHQHETPLAYLSFPTPDYTSLFTILTLGVSTLPADFNDDAGVSDDDDGERDEVEEGDAEHCVRHLSAVVIVEEPERHTLVEVGVARVRLHVEDDTLLGPGERRGKGERETGG